MSVKFDHSEPNIAVAMGIDEHRSDVLDAIIFYTLIDQQMMAESLFDNLEEAPLNLTTKTGLLETLFESSKNEAERIYMSLEYSKIDQYMQNKARGFREFMASLHMLYQGTDGNKDKFISKFLSVKANAKAAYEAGKYNEEDED